MSCLFAAQISIASKIHLTWSNVT